MCLKGSLFSCMFPYRDLFGLLGPYFSGSIFSVLWVTFDPTSCKYADHQNRWIAKDSPHVVLGPYFGCRQVSLFIKSWVPIFKFVFLSLQKYPKVFLFFQQEKLRVAYQFIAVLGNPKIFSAMALAMSIYRTLCALVFLFFPENFSPRDAHFFWQWASKLQVISNDHPLTSHWPPRTPH